MDPNANLTEIRSELSDIAVCRDSTAGTDPGRVVEAAERVVTLFDALDEWLSKGGFLPDAWRRPVVPAFGVNPLIDDMLHTVFLVALEGGIGYWAASSTYHWSNDPVDGGERPKDLEGFYSDVEDAEGDDAFPAARIDRAVIAKGFELVHAGPVEGMHESIRAKFLTMLMARLGGYNDDRVYIDFDAGDADCLVQAGFLGTVVFG